MDRYIRESYQKGYEEGRMIGRLEKLVEFIEEGIFTIQEAAEIIGMEEIEFRMKAGLGFPPPNKQEQEDHKERIPGELPE